MNNQNKRENRHNLMNVILVITMLITLICQPILDVYATEEIVIEESTEEVTEEVTEEPVVITEEPVVITEEPVTQAESSRNAVIQVPSVESEIVENAGVDMLSEITYPSKKITTGNFKLILPSSDVDKKMEVTILIPRTTQVNETYSVSINDVSEDKTFILGWDSGLAMNALSLTLSGVDQGSTIVVDNIITTLNTIHSEYYTSSDIAESNVHVNVSYTGGTAMENATLAAIGENPVTLVTDETTTMGYQVTTGNLSATTVVAPDTGTYGDFQLVLPEQDADDAAEYMNANIYIKRTEQDAVNENYLVTVADKQGNVIKSEVMQFLHQWSSSDCDGEHLSLQLTNIPEGGTVSVKDIIVTKNVGGVNGEGSNDITQVGVALTNTDGTTWNNDIQSLGSNPVQLVSGNIRITKFINSSNVNYEDSKYQTIVTTDFNESHEHSEGNEDGEHKIRCLINSFNVFSFNDIESTHIVGPIMAKESAYRNRETPVATTQSSGELVAADYSRGVPSYVGTITANAIGSRAFAMNYGYDSLYNTGFVYPNLFTSTSTWLIKNGTVDDPQEYVLTDKESVPFLSPNHDGRTSILHNDNYLNFTALYKELIEESKALVEDGNIEDSTENQVKTFDSSTQGSVLTVQAGEAWNITDASQLTQVDIIIPEEYDYFMNPYPFPTTISISDTTINPTIMGGKTVSQFPLATINGAQYDITHLGEFTEYNEFGNKLVWNMPNLVTNDDGANRLVTYAEGQNIPGHMIMPQAEFWNYHEENGALVWEGGNINGSIIAKDFHSGRAEMHMWAYDGLSERGTYFEVKATKTVNGKLPEESFQFSLEPEGEVQAGNINNNFPIIATSDKAGKINFSTLVFNEAGTYTYHIKEIIPSDTGGMTYDQSIYKLTVEVTSTSDGDLIATGTYARINDSLGVAQDVSVDSVSFNNLDSTAVAFPSTGGFGKEPYLLLGIALLFVSSMLYRRRAI